MINHQYNEFDILKRLIRKLIPLKNKRMEYYFIIIPENHEVLPHE